MRSRNKIKNTTQSIIISEELYTKIMIKAENETESNFSATCRKILNDYFNNKKKENEYE